MVVQLGVWWWWYHYLLGWHHRRRLLQSPWWRRQVCSISIMVSWQRGQYESTWAYFALFFQYLALWLCVASYFSCVWLWGNTMMELSFGTIVLLVSYITALRYIATFPSQGGCFTSWCSYKLMFGDHMIKWQGQNWGMREWIFWGFRSWQNKQGMG